MTAATRSLLPFGLMTATLLALATSSTAHAQKVLKWKFKEGDTIQYASRELSDVYIDAGGFEIGTIKKQTLDETWTVKSVAADGTATITRKIDRIQFYIDNDFIGELEYDSKNPSAEVEENQIWTMIGPVFEAMLAGEHEMKISARGEVSEIIVAEQLTKLFEEREGQEGNQFAFILGIVMSEDGVKDELHRSVALLPGGAVSSDTTWTQIHEVSQGPFGTQKTAINYSYAGMEEKDGKSLEKIDLKTLISFQPAEKSEAESEEEGEAESEEEGEAESEVEIEIIEQESSGLIYFDADAGRVIYSKLEQSIVIEAFMMERDIIQEREVTSEVMLGTSDDLPAEEDESEESEQ